MKSSNDWTPGDSARAAKENARRILSYCDDAVPETVVILGSRWGGCLKVADLICIANWNGFADVEAIEGHDLTLGIAQIADRRVLVQDGRVHAYQGSLLAVRQQVEMYAAAGVRNIVLTAAVGSLNDDELHVGDIVFPTTFLSTFAGGDYTPLKNSEHFTAVQALDGRAAEAAMDLFRETGRQTRKVRHTFYRGPHYESYEDKIVMARNGGEVVGMSVLPELLTAARFGMHAVSVVCVSNTMEEHDPDEVRTRMQTAAPTLGVAVTCGVGAFPS